MEKKNEGKDESISLKEKNGSPPAFPGKTATKHDTSLNQKSFYFPGPIVKKKNKFPNQTNQLYKIPSSSFEKSPLGRILNSNPEH